MKKITLLFLIFIANWQINAQSTCNQTFTISGYDDEATTLTINAADITCSGANPITSLKLTNAAGDLTSGFCSSDASGWYGFDLSIDGGAIITGCAADFNDVDITGFTTLTITSHDDDAYSDYVDIEIDVEVTYTASLPPACVALLTPANAAVDVASSIISWPIASGGATGYKLNVGTTPGGTNVLNAFDAGNVQSYDLGILNSATVYYVTVIPYNAVGDAVGPCAESSFTTCGAVSVLPWTENFDSLATVGNTSFPGCWTNENGGWSTAVATAYNTPRSGANYLRDNWGATDEYMWTKGFNLVGGTSYDFSVYVQGDNGDTWIVDMFANNTASSTGATQLGASYNVPGAGAPYSPQSYNEMRRTFVPATSGVYYFAVRVNEPSSDPWYLAFDDFKVEVTPPCAAPANVLVSGITPSTATIAWDAIPGSANYEYVLDNIAADPAGAGTSTMAVVYNATPLTENTVYYFHVRNNCGAEFSAWTTVMFTTLPTPPSNDDCAGATVLTPYATFAASSIVATIVGATDSEVADPTIAEPGCASYVGGDVWFSAVVPASGEITFETGNEPGGFTDSGLAVYSGACGALSLEDCDDDSSVDGAFSLIALTGRTPGEVLYARAWRYNNALPLVDNGVGGRNVDAIGQFRIAAYDASLSNASFDLNGFSAYPNPVKDVLNLSYTKNISNVSIHNLLGQEIVTKSINATQTQIDLSNLSNGTYLVKITVDNLVKTLKVVKQ